MNAYDRSTNLEKKNLADSVAIHVRGRELFRPPTHSLAVLSCDFVLFSVPAIQYKISILLC